MKNKSKCKYCGEDVFFIENKKKDSSFCVHTGKDFVISDAGEIFIVGNIPHRDICKYFTQNGLSVLS